MVSGGEELRRICCNGGAHMTKPSGGAVTNHSIPDGLGNDKAEPWTTGRGNYALFPGAIQRFGTIPQMYNYSFASRASAFLHRGAKLHR